MSDKSAKSSPKISTILSQLFEGATTRVQIASLEFAMAKNNAVKVIVNGVVAALFGLFALAFISLALLIFFWEDHRVFVSCSLAVFYLVLFLFFLGRGKALAANLPYAFEESKQIWSADMVALRNSFTKQAQPERASSHAMSVDEGKEDASK